MYIHVRGHSTETWGATWGDMSEIPLACYCIFTGILWEANIVALILSNWWLAVYSCLDLIPKENIPPAKTFSCFSSPPPARSAYIAPIMWSSHIHTQFPGWEVVREMIFELMNKIWALHLPTFSPEVHFHSLHSLHHQCPLTVTKCQSFMQGTVFFQSYRKWCLKEIQMHKWKIPVKQETEF